MSDEISRERWVVVFRDGVKRGASERKSEPQNRRDEHPDREQYDAEAEREAFDAGFEYGRDHAVPGADLDVDGKAHTTFDRSEYSDGLGRWTDV